MKRGSRKAIKRLREKTTRLRPMRPTGVKVAHAPSRKDRKSAPWRKQRRDNPPIRPLDYGEPARIHERREARHIQKQQTLGEFKALLREAEAAALPAPRRRWWHRLMWWRS